MAGMSNKQVIAMKTRAFPALVIGIAMSCTTWAGDPIDPVALGNFDGMLATCREANPGGKAAYDTLREGMIGEQPESVLAALMHAPEYKQAFDSAREKAAAEPRDTARKGCNQLATALGPHAHPSAKRATSAKSAKSAKSATRTTGGR
jgi:hypothetical protein